MGAVYKFTATSEDLVTAFTTITSSLKKVEWSQSHTCGNHRFIIKRDKTCMVIRRENQLQQLDLSGNIPLVVDINYSLYVVVMTQITVNGI